MKLRPARARLPSIEPLHQIEGALRKPVAFLIVPIFGFTNASASFTGGAATTLIEALKDQRDQDQRRREQQVQQVQAELWQQQLVLVKKQDDCCLLTCAIRYSPSDGRLFRASNYAVHAGTNYYLSLWSHKETDAVLRRRIEVFCRLDFPLIADQLEPFDE